jgi:hypothetical protein
MFSNSVQSFFQLWFLKCKSSIHSIILYNLWKFQLSIFNGLEMGRYSVKRSEKFQNWNVFQLCKVIFFNYDFRSANLQFVVLFFITFENFSFPSGLEMGKSSVESQKKMLKLEYFPTMHSHFSNYDFQSANLQLIVFFFIICENFDLPL